MASKYEMNIKDVSKAMAIFEEAASKQAESIEVGNYKIANEYHSKIVRSVDYLRKSNKIGDLRIFLNHKYVGVRMWSAAFLLKDFEKESLAVLKSIASGEGIHSLTAQTTIDVWNKGEINL